MARLPETGVPPPSPMRSVGPSLPVALLLDPPLLSPMSSVGPSLATPPPPPLLCMPPPPPSAPYWGRYEELLVLMMQASLSCLPEGCRWADAESVDRGARMRPPPPSGNTARTQASWMSLTWEQEKERTL